MQDSYDVEHFLFNQNIRNANIFPVGLKIFYLNICSLQNKLDDLEFLLHELNVEFDILVVGSMIL